ncbi:MAG: ABC transporter ATP-binding protein [Desulfobacteraceae bacterium]|nr:ABC transporter ATP-binding protein [Desulfobacteraceae bacterium]
MKSIELIKPQLFQDRYRIVLGLLCLIIVDLLQLIIPRIIKQVVDALAVYNIDREGLAAYGLMIVVIGILIGGFRYVWRRCLLGMARRVEERLRNRLFGHMQLLSAAYFDKTSTGDIMAHATNDIQQVRMACGMGMVALNDAIFLGIAAIGFMVYIHWELTVYVLIPMPLIAVSAKFFGKKMHARYKEVQALFSDLTEAVRERFAGIRVIKAYTAEAVEADRVNGISRDYIDKNIKLTQVTGSFFPLMLLFTNVSLFLVLVLGGRKAITAEITPGDFVAFISYLGLLTWPMMALGWVTNLIQRGRASLDRLNAILETRPEVKEASDPAPFPNMVNALEFRHVGFAYGGRRQNALSRVGFRIEKGQMLGLIGPPGSGKSTALLLLLRMYDVDNGEILLDGTNIRHLKLSRLRSQIAFTPQEPFLFAGTIGENIRIGKDDITAEELVRATKKACVYDSIMGFPDGFDTLVGEKGVILSGGQKQRIALARAFLKDARIMLFDDPISQVDTQTGNRIVDGIRRLIEDKIMIVASHRLSAVRFADRILVLKNGRIEAAGDHAALMAGSPYYERTYNLQELEDEI